MLDLTALSLVISPKTGEEMSIASLAVPADDMLYSILTVASGLFWTAAYIMIIYRGFKDKTCGMPLMVLGLNWAWEFIFCFLGAPIVEAGSALDLTGQTAVQRVMNGMWFTFDCVILYLKFKYGKDEFKHAFRTAPDWMFYPYMILIIGISFACVLFTVNEWGDHNGVYAAYIQNIFISATFIQMMYRKGNSDGQSMGIAICKCVGTIAPGLMGALVMIREYGATWPIFLDFEFMPLMKFLIECCLVFDIIYIVMLYRMMKYHDHLNPWTRKPLPRSKWDKNLKLAVIDETADAPVCKTTQEYIANAKADKAVAADDAKEEI